MPETNSTRSTVASKKAQFPCNFDTILCEYGAFVLTNFGCCNFTCGCVAYRSSANAIGIRIIIHIYILYYYRNAYKCKICIVNEDIRTSKLLRYFIYRKEKEEKKEHKPKIMVELLVQLSLGHEQTKSNRTIAKQKSQQQYFVGDLNVQAQDKLTCTLNIKRRLKERFGDGPSY